MPSTDADQCAPSSVGVLAPGEIRIPDPLVRSQHSRKLSFDFISKFRVAPVAFGTTEHNRAQPNTQKSRNHLAILRHHDDLVLFRKVGIFDYLATLTTTAGDYLFATGCARRPRAVRTTTAL
jgi:hypothetical protein